MISKLSTNRFVVIIDEIDPHTVLGVENFKIKNSNIKFKVKLTSHANSITQLCALQRRKQASGCIKFLDEIGNVIDKVEFNIAKMSSAKIDDFHYETSKEAYASVKFKCKVK